MMRRRSYHCLLPSIKNDSLEETYCQVGVLRNIIVKYYTKLQARKMFKPPPSRMILCAGT